MSGHSKWHNIQGRKGKQDAARSNQFTKAAKAITIAAQKGGDPAMNFSLRIAVDKAKAISMPKDNIERAIKRGTGEIEGDKMEEVMYEGFGPGGVAILIKCVTDNKNRTVSDLKHILSVHEGSFASAGSVQWMFVQAGFVAVPNFKFPISNFQSQDDFELAMIDAGAEDFVESDSEIEIKTKVDHLHAVVEKLKELGVEPKEQGIRWMAKDKLSVSLEIESKLGDLFAELEEHDDVEDYFTNAE